ncbi:MAG: hypothetical protein K6E86_03630 [Bacteroidales bacterium]|nr:hypothetical protein [Bacteroidales bacterium]
MKTSKSLKSLFLGFVFSFAVLPTVFLSSCSDDDKEDNPVAEESVVGLWKSQYEGDAGKEGGLYTVSEYLLLYENKSGVYATVSKYDTVVDWLFWQQKDSLISVSPVVEDEDFICENPFVFNNGKLYLSWKEEDDTITEVYERSEDDIQELIESATAK